MIDTSRARRMLLGLVVLVHGALFWWLWSPSNYATPPVEQSIIVAMLLASPQSQPMPKAVQRIPRVQTPVLQAVMQELLIEPPVQLTELTELQQPIQEATVQQTVPSLATALLPPRFDAAYLNNPAPAYPSSARRLGIQGKVLLRVQVSVEGHATTVQLHQSSGSTALDEAAMVAVRKWRFVPARQGAVLAAAWVLVPIDFKLD